MPLVLDVAFTVKEGMEQEFEDLVTGLSRDVLANEPGASMYQLCRSQTEKGVYRLIEVYADADALAAHGQSAHYKAAAPRFGPCLAAPPTLEKFETV